MQDVVFWPWQLVAYRPADFQHCKIIWDYNFELYFYHSSFSFQKLAEFQELERSHMALWGTTLRRLNSPLKSKKEREGESLALLQI